MRYLVWSLVRDVRHGGHRRYNNLQCFLQIEPDWKYNFHVITLAGAGVGGRGWGERGGDVSVGHKAQEVSFNWK